MENCSVKRNRSVVDNDNLPVYGTAVVGWENTSKVASLVLNGSGNYKIIEGTFYSSAADAGDPSGKTPIPATGTIPKNFYICQGASGKIQLDKYSLTKIQNGTINQFVANLNDFDYSDCPEIRLRGEYVQSDVDQYNHNVIGNLEQFVENQSGFKTTNSTLTLDVDHTAVKFNNVAMGARSLSFPWTITFGEIVVTIVNNSNVTKATYNKSTGVWTYA